MGQSRLFKAYRRTAAIITVHHATTERNDLNTCFFKASISETMSDVLFRAIVIVRCIYMPSSFCKLNQWPTPQTFQRLQRSSVGHSNNDNHRVRLWQEKEASGKDKVLVKR